MIPRRPHLSFFAFIFFLASCANLSTFQTGRVLPEDSGRFMTGVSYFISPNGEPGRDLKYAMFETDYRVGLGSDFELGGKFTLPGTLGADVKYGIYADTDWAVATGLGLGFLAFPAGTASPSSQYTQSFVEGYFPIYVSYDLSKKDSIYLAPKLLVRKPTSAGDLQTFVGSSAGVKLGDKVGFFLEVSAFTGLSGGPTQAQIGGALFFGK